MPMAKKPLADTGVPGAVDASSLQNIQKIIKALQLDLAVEHQIWCNHVWRNGARFAVLPARLPGKGIGIIATHDIESGEQIALIPPNLLYTTNNVPSSIKKQYPKLAGHGLLAAGLMHETLDRSDNPYREWIKTWPTMTEFETSMPLLLPPHHRKPFVDENSREKFILLPPAICGIWIDSSGAVETRFEGTGSLPKQEAKVNRDIAAIRAAKRDRSIECSSDLMRSQTFRWMWLIVNTRSFYYDLPLRTKPKNTADKMCLCPFLDYFNHADEGCNVSYNDQGFAVIANRFYKKGEEVVISYGAHGNDLLWTDYGFLLQKNLSDSVCIDAWMLDPSTGIAEPETQKLLEDAGYWRNYTLNNEGPCYRTEMAIRTQTLSSIDWQRLVNGEVLQTPTDKIERDTKTFLVNRVLEPCIARCKATVNAIEAAKPDLPPAMTYFALERWRQICSAAENCAEIR